MTDIVQIQQITIADFENLISEIVRNEVSKLIPKEPTNPKGEVYGTRKDVAKELKISLPILNEHTKSGQLPAYRIGGRVLYKWNEVFESIQNNKYNENK